MYSPSHFLDKLLQCYNIQAVETYVTGMYMRKSALELSYRLYSSLSQEKGDITAFRNVTSTYDNYIILILTQKHFPILEKNLYEDRYFMPTYFHIQSHNFGFPQAF